MAASSRSLWTFADPRRARLSLRNLLRLCIGLVALSAACSVGHGTGEIGGTLNIAGCRRAGAYTLAPNAFFAQTAEKLLNLRVQRGGDMEIFSDGLSVLIKDAALLKQEYLGVEIDLASVGGGAPGVSATAYFNDTCPSHQQKIPAAMQAVSGSMRFLAVYAPRVNEDEVRITAELSAVRFEDAEDPGARWAELSGHFDFLYVRGSPAQRFP